MSDCLDDQNLGRYRSGAMSATELLLADAHVASCASCRGRLLQPERLAVAIESLARKVRWDSRVEINCPDDETIARYVEKTLDPVDVEVIGSHLELCSRCIEDVRSLRELQRVLSAQAPTVYGPQPATSLPARLVQAARRMLVSEQRLRLALVAACLLLGALLARQWWVAAGLDQQLDARKREVAGLAGERQEAQGRARASEAELRRAQDELDRTVQALTQAKAEADRARSSLASARVPGYGRSANADLTLAVGELLERGHVEPTKPVLVAMARLGPEGDVVRSGDEEAPLPLAPVQTLVLTTQPPLRWKPVKGATGYVVSLFSEGPRRLLWERKAGPAAQLAYPREEPPLQYGKAYSWMVEAQGEAGMSRSNLVKFQVIAASRLEEILNLSRRYSGLGTVLVALYEREGLYDQAEATLEELLRNAPESDALRRMLHSLQERRSGMAK